MAFSGAWRRETYLDPAGRVVHTADPAHGETGPDESVNATTYTTPEGTDEYVGALPEFPGMEWIAETAGRILDRTNYESHEGSGHSVDLGADEAGYFNEREMMFADEKYLNPRFEGNTAPAINPVALQRGLNGLPENNPEGFRLGWVDQSWVNRKFAVGERVSDQRILVPDVAYAEINEAPPIDNGPYPTPFASLARSITNINQRPTARREPPPMLGDEIDDGSPYYQAVDPWVVG